MIMLFVLIINLVKQYYILQYCIFNVKPFFKTTGKDIV